MKVIALCQAYNEGEFIHQCLQWATKVCDEIILTEGCLTPFGNQSRRSEDNTRKIIQRFKQSYDVGDKIKFFDAFEAKPAPSNREQYEGMNKNFMLKKSNVEDGDLVFILDVDEFWHEDRFINIVEKFKKNDRINHIPIEEYQFAYNFSLYFNASHDGRFMRYVEGARFASTNHFIHPNGKDVTKDYTHLVKREDSQMCHFCWTKHPKLIKQKVESFNRPSFTAWYNYVYLNFPLYGEKVYELNRRIAPHCGTGFAEGQHEPLKTFKYKLPWPVAMRNTDYLNYIKRHYEELLI